MTIPTLYYGNTNVIEVRGLRDTTDGSYVNDATVTVTLKDNKGDEIGGEDWPKSLPYVPNSNGYYRVTINSDLVVTEKQRVMVDVVITSGTLVARITTPMNIVRRN